jgi:protein O-GlcNAc transferase
MDALPCYLAHARLAPVQCVTWGHPLTTGLPTIDFFISSKDLEPIGAEAHYSEQLVKLAHLANYYYRPEPVISKKRRADFGLAEGDHLYLCPQSLFKLHPDDDAVFRQIVEQDPSARIVLIEGQQPTWSGILRERLSSSMGQASDRVQFVARQAQSEFQRLLELADVMLDPLHFGGGNTSFEAFSVGTPIVTLPGGFLRSRITYALYRWMGLDDCVAKSTADYVAKAVRLASDPRWRERVRASILAENHKLYENLAGVRELESFLSQAAHGHREHRA